MIASNEIKITHTCAQEKNEKLWNARRGGRRSAKRISHLMEKVECLRFSREVTGDKRRMRKFLFFARCTFFAIYLFCKHESWEKSEVTKHKSEKAEICHKLIGFGVNVREKIKTRHSFSNISLNWILIFKKFKLTLRKFQLQFSESLANIVRQCWDIHDYFILFLSLFCTLFAIIFLLFLFKFCFFFKFSHHFCVATVFLFTYSLTSLHYFFLWMKEPW